MALEKTVRQFQQSKETMRDMHKLHGTERYNDRQPKTIRDSERHLATPRDLSDSDRKPAMLGVSERHTAT